MTIHIALLRAVATGESPQQSLPRVASLIVAECSMKRVLATLSQATPVLHASNTNSGAPYLFFGTTVGLVYALGRFLWKTASRAAWIAAESSRK